MAGDLNPGDRPTGYLRSHAKLHALVHGWISPDSLPIRSLSGHRGRSSWGLGVRDVILSRSAL